MTLCFAPEGAMGDVVGDDSTELVSLPGHVVRCNGLLKTECSRKAPTWAKSLQKGTWCSAVSIGSLFMSS